MSLKLGLQSVSDWVKELASLSKGIVVANVKSGLLKDSLDDLCAVGGAAGALFKLGAMVLPDETPEQRIASTLGRALLNAVDKQLVKNPDLIKTAAWAEFRKRQISHAAKETLSTEFTWLEVFQSDGLKRPNHWPIIVNLADFTRNCLWGAARIDNPDDSAVEQTIDDIRAFVHRELEKSLVELLVEDETVKRELEAQVHLIPTESLAYLASQIATFSSRPLFGEIPQDRLYVSPTLKVWDYSTAVERGPEPKTEKHGDDWVFQHILNSNSGCVTVLTGSMGVGKSCLMRAVASRLARKYQGRQPSVIFVKWREIYESADLMKGISTHLNSQYRMPFPNLSSERNIIFCVDGFDEMRTHDPREVASYYDRLRALADEQASRVVVAMRSTVVSDNTYIKNKWRDDKATIVEIQPFDDPAVDEWTRKWRTARQRKEPTGAGLRKICGGASDVLENPLLLFMLTKSLTPGEDYEVPRKRSEIFRTFVDSTIEGKARLALLEGDKFPFPVPSDYRLLLQEIAWIASWPKHGGKCPEHMLEAVLGVDIEGLEFDNVRTAFVLHFFEPSDIGNEFEFHPEGFRHYLLAEWFARAHLETLSNRKPARLFARSREKATNAIAQLSVQHTDERRILNEVFEDLPYDKPKAGLSRLGFPNFSESNIEELLEVLRDRCETPHADVGEADSRVGVPQHEAPLEGFSRIRLIANYWDSCLVAALGLTRALPEASGDQRIFPAGSGVMQRMLALNACVLGNGVSSLDYNLTDIDLSFLDLSTTQLRAVLGRTDFSGSKMRNATIHSRTQGPIEWHFCDCNPDKHHRRLTSWTPDRPNINLNEFPTHTIAYQWSTESAAGEQYVMVRKMSGELLMLDPSRFVAHSKEVRHALTSRGIHPEFLATWNRDAEDQVAVLAFNKLIEAAQKWIWEGQTYLEMKARLEEVKRVFSK